MSRSFGPVHPWRVRPSALPLEDRSVPAVIPANAVALGPDQGGDPRAVVFDSASGKEVFSHKAFEQSFRGGVSVALGDVTGDGVPDLVAAARSGGGPRVQVVDGATGKELQNFFVFEESFRGGVTVAVGDVNGDGVGDIITGTGSGGGPRVTVIDFETGDVIRDFLAFEGSFRGGVNVAAGDVNDDGFDDIVVGTGGGGGPRVVTIDGKTGEVLQDFFAFDPSFRNGVNVGTGDRNGDGRDDVVVGAGKGGGPQVRVIDGLTGRELENFFAFADSIRDGVQVGTTDSNRDGLSEILAATKGQVRRIDIDRSIRLGNDNEIDNVSEFTNTGTFVNNGFINNGVFIGVFVVGDRSFSGSDDDRTNNGGGDDDDNSGPGGGEDSRGRGGEDS